VDIAPADVRVLRGVHRPGYGQGRRDDFRRIFRVITAVWGVGFLLEAALRVAIVYNTSPGTALSLSKVTPYIWVAIFVTWTVAYGRYQQKKGQRMMAAAAAAAAAGAAAAATGEPGTNGADPQPASQP